MCNYSVSQIFFQIDRKSVEMIGLEGRRKTAHHLNICEFSQHFIRKIFYNSVQEKSCTPLVRDTGGGGGSEDL